MVNHRDVALIAVMGKTGSGKSEFVNMASGSDRCNVGNSLVSCTKEIMESDQFDADMNGNHGKYTQKVILIDTPGFDDSTSSKSDTDILKLVATHLKGKYGNNSKLTGVIYLQRISDPRRDDIFSRNLRIMRNMCDPRINVFIATTFWNKATEEEGAAREKELQESSNIVDVWRWKDRSRQSALDIIQGVLSRQTDVGPQAYIAEMEERKTILTRQISQTKKDKQSLSNFTTWLRKLFY